MRLIREGVRLGLFSDTFKNGLPNYIWNVRRVGKSVKVYEAKLGAGKYHGYPLDPGEARHKQVLAERKRRKKRRAKNA